MRSVIIHTYKKALPQDLASIIRRQTYKIWDHGDTITYGLPGGKMTTYQFIDRKADAEVLEQALAGWSAPSAPALVYEVEVGLTKDPNIIIIGEHLRTSRCVNYSGGGVGIDDSIYNMTELSAPKPRVQVSAPEQRTENNSKRKQHKSPAGYQQAQPTSIALASFLHVHEQQKQPEGVPVRRKVQPKIPLISIPLSG